MINSKIFTENPEQEQWRALLQYSYKANIRRYFNDSGIVVSGTDGEESEKAFDRIADAIAGAMLQADEYYRASQVASLHVEPLLLYYGTTNLLYAMSMLVSGQRAFIQHHGMKTITDINLVSISNTRIQFSHSSDGGIHVFAKNLGFAKDLCDYNQCEWTLGDFFDSIAEISNDYCHCYGQASKILLLDVVKTAEGIVEKVNAKEESGNIFINVEGFSKAYLRPQEGKNEKNESVFVLRHKINGIDISRISYSGQPYLQIAHDINGRLITIPEEINMYISLFALCSMCRYNPNIWYPFVTQDSTGERLLIEKLLYYSRRIIPNAVLNRIERRQISFVSDKYVPEDRIHLVGEHEVKDMVRKEVVDQMSRQQANNIVQQRRR